MTWTRFSYVIPACSIYILDNKQQPIFIQEGEKFILKVWTFEQIGSVLKVAGDKKCQEAQACLEGTTCTYVFFLNFIFFQLCIANLRERSSKLNKRREGGRRGDWEGMDRQPVKNN